MTTLSLASPGLCLLLYVLHVSEASPAVSISAAAASGAIYGAGVGGGGRPGAYRDENAEARDF